MKMTLNIYDVENGNLEDNLILIDTIEGETNQDCENKAADKYSDSDSYAWSYCLSMIWYHSRIV
jgi:hypothetical protein